MKRVMVFARRQIDFFGGVRLAFSGASRIGDGEAHGGEAAAGEALCGGAAIGGFERSREGFAGGVLSNVVEIGHGRNASIVRD